MQQRRHDLKPIGNVEYEITSYLEKTYSHITNQTMKGMSALYDWNLAG
jgi:hypothetical protein